MNRREALRWAGGTAMTAALVACGDNGGPVAVAACPSLSTARRRVVTADGVNLSVIDIGDPSRPALLFVHGLSQAALSWLPQLTSPALLAKYRLVAVDLRGHGLSQGAYAAIDDRGNALPVLTNDRYVAPTTDLVTSQLWSNDLEAVILQLGLVTPSLVGWSYGVSVVFDYMRQHAGLGAANKVVVTGGSPVLLGVGAAGGGGAEIVFGSGVAPAVFKTTDDNLLVGAPGAGPPSIVSDVVVGMSQFVQLALSDTVAGRPVATREEVLAATTYNIQLPPAAREAIVLRQFDHRPFLAALPTATKGRMLVLTGLSDQVIQAATTGPYFDALGIPQKRFAGEGHAFFARNPASFNAELLAFVG